MYDQQALQQARGSSNLESAVAAFGHLQSYQARGCDEWEELCSHKSSPELALLMMNMGLWGLLKMALLSQLSRSVC